MLVNYSACRMFIRYFFSNIIFLKISKRFSIALWLGFISLVIGMYFEFSNEIIFQIGIALSIILCGVALSVYWNKPIMIEKKTPPTTADGLSSAFQKSELMISVSAALYAILAGLSIAKTMEFAFEAIIDNFDNFGSEIQLISSDTMYQILSSHANEILMASAFLITAIPFYHGAMVYLSDKSRNIELESTQGLAFHFYLYKR